MHYSASTSATPLRLPSTPCLARSSAGVLASWSTLSLKASCSQPASCWTRKAVQDRGALWRKFEIRAGDRPLPGHGDAALFPRRRGLRLRPRGSGRGATTDVPGNPVADRPVAGTARASMRSAGIRCDKRRQQRWASMQTKLRVSPPRRSHLIGSTLAAHAVRDLPLPKTGVGTILATTTPNPGNVGQSGKASRSVLAGVY